LLSDIGLSTSICDSLLRTIMISTPRNIVSPKRSVNLPNVAPIPEAMLSDDVVVVTLDSEDGTEDCQRSEDEDSGSKYGSLYAYR
jgi:hypothetical protein